MALKDHLEKLNYFFQVAKSGSIKEASTRVNLSQPSVTKSIQVLEQAINKQLFVRLPRGVVLTREGEILFQYCHTLFSDLENLEVKLTAPDDPMAGNLKVGTYDSIAIYFWPHFLRTFLPMFPRLNIDLTTNRSHVVQKMVESGELDLGMTIEPQANSHVDVIDLTTDQFQFYKSTRMVANYTDDSGAPIIFMPDALAGERQRRLTHLLSGNEGSAKRSHYTTSSLESAKELTISGIGIGLLPKMVAEDAVKKKKIKKVEIKGFPKAGLGEHRIGLVFPRHKKDSPVLQGIIREIRTHSW